MARPRYPKHTGPPPPALPPVAQTVGQLVAETLRLYGSRFVLALPLGLPLALADQLTRADDWIESVVVLAATSPIFTAGYVLASCLAHGARPSARSVALAMLLGTVVFALAAPLLAAYVIVGIAWLALFGHVVPAVIVEGRGARDAIRRAAEIARADYVHAVGGLATLVILFYLTRILLEGLLRSQADNTRAVAVLLADVVLSPIVMLGGALLFTNLAARVGVDRDERKRARAEAMATMRGRSQ
ncbi:MAG: hypothetical protein FJW96_09165 [Actinobacteria bacterium]|nr:hypothetical protein [Actinomycetota bacterium]